MKREIPNFKIGITFSGRYREDYVEPFCNALLDLGYCKNEIFYDKWHEHIINGINGDEALSQIYYQHCELIVVLLSPDYKRKPWCGNVEWRAVKELINTGNDEKICLLRVDSANIGAINGLYQTQSVAKSIDEMLPRDVAKFIDKMYKQILSPASSGIYKRPPFIPHTLEGVLIKEEWKKYISNMVEKVAYFAQWFGSVEEVMVGSQPGCRAYYYRGEILIRFIFTLDTEVAQIKIWDGCRNGTEQSGACVFDVDNRKGYMLLHEFIPGDWDNRIFSWEAKNSSLPIMR